MQVKNYMYGLSSLVCYSFFGLLTKSLYNYNIDEFVMLFYICLFSFLYFSVSSLVQNKFDIKNTFKASKRDALLSFFNSGFLAIFIPCATSVISLKYIDTGVQRAIVFSSAIYIIIIEFMLFNRKINKSTLIYSIGMVGSLLLISGNIKLTNGFSQSLFGISMAFVSAIAYAVYSVIAERHRVQIKDLVLWVYAYLFAIVCSFICIISTGKLSELNIFYNSRVVIEVALSAVICTGLAEDFMLKSIKTVGGVKTNAILALVPVSTLIVGFLFLNETITLWQLIGFFILIISTIKIK